MSYTDANEGCEALEEHEEDAKYSIALTYLGMSQQSHLELMRVYRENDLDHHEIESYFSVYEEFVYQLKRVITVKDQNTSWLSETHDRLVECFKFTNDFLTNQIVNGMRQK